MQVSSQSDLEAPFYVIDVQRLREKYLKLEHAFRQYFDDLVIGYSYKTNYLPAICMQLHEMGAWAEVVSSLEYSLAERLGVSRNRIILNGPIKSLDTVAHALDNGSLLNIDSVEEACHVREWARNHRGRIAKVGLRLNLPFMDENDSSRSRFGLSLEDDTTGIPAAMKILECDGIQIIGLHAHLSTKRRSLGVFERIAKALAGAAQRIGTEHLEYFDIGGGFGFAPAGLASLRFPTFIEYAGAIHQALESIDPWLAKRRLIIEPGMALVGDCASFFTPIRSMKLIGDRKVLFVDGSIHNVKPTRHKHNLPTTVLNPRFEEKLGASHHYDVVGYTCMEDDYLARQVPLVIPTVGDILRIDNVGAYTIVFKPPFIRGMPAIYILKDDKLELGRPAETIGDIFDAYVP